MLKVPRPPTMSWLPRVPWLSRVLWLPRDRRVQSAVLVVLLVIVVLGGFVLFHRDSTAGRALPPTPPAPATASGTSAPAPAQSSAPTRKKPAVPSRCHPRRATTFGGARPQQICVPAIGVNASVLSLGLNADRTVQVPPLSQVGEAGWYQNSAAPGAKGEPTVILGHVDSAVYGDGVFYRLGTLTKGDRVMLTRDDGHVATYQVTKVDEVSKSHFPTQAVYGPAAGSTIRLVTCGGQFDSATGNYLDNIIAYGTLVSLTEH